jgi:hypothetical protein
MRGFAVQAFLLLAAAAPCCIGDFSDPAIDDPAVLTGNMGNTSALYFDYFGHSVAMSSDGTTVLVGAPYRSTASPGRRRGYPPGAAFVYTYDGGAGTWVRGPVRLLPRGGSDDAAFGAQVALAGDGRTALVAAPGQDNNNGSVYVFTAIGAGALMQVSE